MAQAQQEILWKPDADIPQDDVARRPSTRFQICDLCRNVLTSPDILQPRRKITSGVPLCGGPLQATQCSLRAMILHRFEEFRNRLSEEDPNKWHDYESMSVNLTPREDIQLESLPQTVKDAIFVTQRLGLKYLWIDAYCIIQDSVGDKNKELARMAEIYSQASVTLSASTAATVHDGFLSRRQPRARCDLRPLEYPRIPLPFKVPNTDGVTGTAILQEDPSKVVTSEDPIMHRSWTFQERVLSRRILSFGSRGLYWQCNGAERSCRAFDGTREFTRLGFLSREHHLNDRSLALEWARLVTQYSHRNVTHEEDRLVAIAGVASRFAEAQGGRDVYLAGLWRSRIHWELLWTTSGSSKRSRPSAYVAPSWSWASVTSSDGVWWYRNPGFDFTCERSRSWVQIAECETTLKSSELPFGQVTGGRIRLRGPLRPPWQPNSRLAAGDEQDTLTTASSYVLASESSDESESEAYMSSLRESFDKSVEWDVDSEPHDPSLVFFLRVADEHSLTLVRAEAPMAFRRVGLYHSRKRSADELFLNSSLADIEII